MHSRSSLENHTRFKTKIGEVYTPFQTKTAQKPYPMGRWGGTYLYSLYKGVSTTPPPPGPAIVVIFDIDEKSPFGFSGVVGKTWLSPLKNSD